ncbi:MAG: hypothetical protein LC790_00665 [Actinobacteria bacterium]|nr:hypothetical protein [Actinomycetota bacterium]
MRSEAEPDDAARDELRQAVLGTLATGSARLRYAMLGNPPELAEYDTGEGVADFRERTSRVAYNTTRTNGSSEGHEGPQLEQVTDRHLSYLRVGGPPNEWIEVELGEPEEFDVPGDAGGFLELLNSPGRVVRLATDEQFDGKPARRYTLAIEPPRSSLRERLSGALGVKGPSQLWLDAWTDAEGRVRRIAACDHAPNPDGALPRGAVRTTVEFDELGVPAPVEAPPSG